MGMQDKIAKIGEQRFDSLLIDILDLSPRSYNCLRRSNVHFLGQLNELLISGKLSFIKNVGSKTEIEIREKYTYFLNSGPTKKTEFIEIIGKPEIKPLTLEEKYYKSLLEFISSIKVKSRNFEIISLRAYGSTLQSIADQYKISRERIRQIISNESLKILRRMNSYSDLIDFIDSKFPEKFLKEIEYEKQLACEYVREFFSSIFQNTELEIAVKFLTFFRIIVIFGKYQDIKKWEKISQFACSVTPILKEDDFVKKVDKERKKRYSYKDLISEVLNDVGSPMHWREIAELVEKKEKINDFHTGTLYNNLIGNSTFFVRVGQGTYGLKNWNLEPVEYYTEIIARVLKENGSPLTLGEILFKVNNIRNINQSSLIMYLDLHLRFYESESNKYGLRIWLHPREQQTLLTPKDFVEKIKSYERVSKCQTRGYNLESILNQDK
jgi:DNA-directed RNA polymerase delta subunit